jgi:molybdenum cofactor cytidylyltransferase
MDHRADEEGRLSVVPGNGAGAGSIIGLLLAAGRGARFDATGALSKLLAQAPAHAGNATGVPVALAAARTLRAQLARVIAVVRPADSAPQQSLHALLRDAGCELAINPHADDGIGTSIAAGVAAAPEAGGWLVALADMPAVAPATVAAVRDALLAGAPTVAPRHTGRRGHPVGFAARSRTELLALTGDEGARSVLLRHPPRLIDVDDAGCLLDLDTPEDFAAAAAPPATCSDTPPRR